MSKIYGELVLISLRRGIRVPERRSDPRRAARALQAARLAALVLVLAPAVARAQSHDPAATTAKVGAEDGRNSFTIVGTATIANGSIEGDAFDRHLFLAGFRYSRTLVHREIATFSYSPELLPGAWLSQPILGDDHQAVQRSIPPFTHTETTVGAGASPIAVELTFLPARMLQPLVGTDEGFLYFSRNVPSPLAARFNFTVAVRLGLRVRLDHGKALSFEYIYHHMSNGYRAVQNPGVDSQMLCFGFIKVLGGS
jgi:hypothetical protein